MLALLVVLRPQAKGKAKAKAKAVVRQPRPLLGRSWLLLGHGLPEVEEEPEVLQQGLAPGLLGPVPSQLQSLVVEAAGKAHGRGDGIEQ